MWAGGLSLPSAPDHPYSASMTTSPRPSPESNSDGLDLSAFRQVDQDPRPSLDELSAALAGMLGSGEDPYCANPTGGNEVIAKAEEQPRGADDEDPCPISPRTILEAMLFVGTPTNQPLTSKQVAGLMRGVRPSEIDALVRELNRDYSARNCPYTIAAEGAGYRMKLRERHARIRDTYYGKARAARLSQAAIDVLAIVAYHAPIGLEEISRLRGKPSGQILLGLVRRQLLRLERSETKPRWTHYYTTPRFLNLFGLESLADLPQSRDLEQG